MLRVVYCYTATVRLRAKLVKRGGDRQEQYQWMPAGSLQ